MAALFLHFTGCYFSKLEIYYLANKKKTSQWRIFFYWVTLWRMLFKLDLKCNPLIPNQQGLPGRYTFYPIFHFIHYFYLINENLAVSKQTWKIVFKNRHRCSTSNKGHARIVSCMHSQRVRRIYRHCKSKCNWYFIKITLKRREPPLAIGYEDELLAYPISFKGIASRIRCFKFNVHQNKKQNILS